MVLPNIKVLPPNIPPLNSNQTPIGPFNPVRFQGVAQQIKTWIPTNLPPTINPGSYTHQGIWPGGVHEIGGVVGRINPPAGYNYQCIPQHITVPIAQIVPPNVYPDTYGAKKMSYGIDAGSVLGGLIAGFIVGAIVFTSTGRKVAGATGERVAYHVAPKAS